MSGSTDGLVNLYDTRILDEEDALHQTINHGASIHCAGFLNDTEIFALSHDEKFSLHEMVTNPEAGVEEPVPIQFGDLREGLKCEYVVDVVSRPDGSAVIGTGSHRYDTHIWIIQVLSPALLTSKKCPSPSLYSCSLTINSKESFELIQFTSGPPWRFVADTNVALAGAHGEEIVRSFCFLDHVRILLIKTGYY